MQKRIIAGKIFNGEAWLYNQQIIVQGGKVLSVEDTDEKTDDGDDDFIAPAFIDFQVYGALKKLLAVYPEAHTLELMEQNFRKEGTVLFQPTLATNTLEVFKKGIDAVKDYWKRGGKAVVGLHLEGPWISKEKKGAHVESLIHAPQTKEVKDLLDYGKGIIKTITLAPEVCSSQVIDLLLKSGVIISAGHSNAGFEESIRAFDKGIKTVTHLFNAMGALHHRQPGLPGAAMMHDQVFASIIPDGHHVDYSIIQLTKKIMGNRLFAITDAVTETHEGLYQHQPAGDKYECNGTLSGSALSMYTAFLNLVNHAKLPVEDALKMCSLIPARVLGVDHVYGKIAPGYTAQFIKLNKQLKLAEVIVE